MKKRISLTITFGVIFTLHTVAQRSQLQGPAAKNYKPWKDPFFAKAVVTKLEKRPSGPKAKNYRLWEGESKTSPVVFSTRKDMKGPEAKNQRRESRTKYFAKSN